MIRQYAFLLDKTALQPAVVMGRAPAVAIAVPTAVAIAEKTVTLQSRSAAPAWGDDAVTVPLIQLAYARSGDKSDTSNIDIIIRQPRFSALYQSGGDQASVAAWLAHLVKGPVVRYDLPGIHAVNFVCEQALGGGGMSSLRNDPLGKGMAQMVLSMRFAVPSDLLKV